MENREVALTKVVVLDFGGQYTHLISRRIRELGFETIILSYDTSIEDLKNNDVGVVAFSGGPASVLEPDSPKPSRELVDFLFNRNIPVLGICYGHQLLAEFFGGRVEKRERGEYGVSLLRVLKENTLFKDTPAQQRVWMSHKDSVVELPESFEVLAETDYSEIAAFKHRERPLYGVQFHPEVRHTEHGMRILENFLREIARLSPSWKVEDVAREKIEEIKQKYRGGKVLMAVSGGVDSTTAALMILKAVGEENIHLVFVDTGLLREGEAESVIKMLRSLGFRYIHFVDASRLFLERLRGIVDPEKKREIIASTFIEVFLNKKKELEEKYGRFAYLGQGTIYPDRVETGKTGKATSKIKSHHNVAIKNLVDLELLEPLADFYKDEVRRIARHLGVPESVVRRHPFPGPGLAIRIVGEVTEEKLRILRKATKIVEEEFTRAGLYDKVWQAFPVLLSVKSVGVKGDARSYENILALRVVESEDGMTAQFTKLPWDFLERLASRLVNEVEGVNRVLYDVTNKPPATIEFE